MDGIFQQMQAEQLLPDLAFSDFLDLRKAWRNKLQVRKSQSHCATRRHLVHSGHFLDLGAARVSELAGKAQEQLQSVGASIWQWGQTLQESVVGEGTTQPEKKAEENWSFSESLWSWGETVTKDLKQTLGPGMPKAQKGYRPDPSGGGGTAGLIKAQEVSLLKQGLLDEEEEEEAGPDLAAIQKQLHPDLLTGHEAVPAVKASASQEPVDLLS
ncbi:unnamed protein product [Effrenium voratum]|nr:unnamed protein product [Effrenium voratum]